MNDAIASLKPLTQRLSSDQVYALRLIPFKEEDECLHCYTDQIPTKDQQQEWQVLLGTQLVLEVLNTSDFEILLSTHFYRSISEEQQLNTEQDILGQILKTAHGIESSDVHFEVFEHFAQVRFRLDGKLKEFYRIPREEYPAIINKIKIKAQLDISEKRLPQDGRIGLATREGEKVDIRVSTLPTLHGEKMVLRILNRSAQRVGLDQLGFNEKDLIHYRKQLKQLQGLIVISGPTGSGKTTTLYATLNEISSPTTNILTIEDPIEYTLEGINQVQLKESIGLNFPNALRTFLRQDPDIIMVGEIRDEETAQMALRAALTGHLVFATLHSNSAWGIISRFLDMGIPSFLLMESLRLCIAQRLVRKICQECKSKSTSFPKGLKIPIPIKTHWVAKGCNSCYHTGYKGRIALYELLPMSDELRKAFSTQGFNEPDFHKKIEYIPLKVKAWELIRDGISSLEEVYSIIAF